MDRKAKQNLDLVLARLIHKSLRPLTLSLALYYGFLAVVHNWFVPPGARLLMTGVAGATAVTLFGMYWVVRKGKVPVGWAHPTEAVMAALVSLNSLAHLYAVGELRQTTNLAFAIVGGGLLFLSTRWLAGFVLASLAGWWLVTQTAAVTGDMPHFAFMLFTATVLAAVAHAFRLRSLRELESTRALLHEKELRKRAEAGRARLELELQHAEKLKSLGILAGGVAHDFNNLLVPVLGNAELALGEPGGLSPAARTYLEEISLAAERATALTKQMLAYCGKGKRVVEPIDLSEVVRENARLLQVSIPKRIALAYELSAELPAIEADVTQIGQVIMNLVINASEAMGEKSGMITLRTGTRELSSSQLADAYSNEPLPAGRYVYLQVCDTGHGMHHEATKKVFDPFFTTKSAGRGLGLAAVSGIVRGHHGAIELETELQRGTTFTVLFPSSNQPVNRKPEAAPAVGSWRSCGTVLVVDDEAGVRALARRTLEKAGFFVLTVTDGAEALKMFRERRSEIGLVILDLTMRTLGGEETFRRLREMQPGLRVIVSSGYSEEDIGGHWDDQDAVIFLQKPFRPAQLLEAVRKQLPTEPPETWAARRKRASS